MFHFPTKSSFLPEQECAATSRSFAADVSTGVSIEGEGTAVVLLHSSLSSKNQWRALMARMRETHRLIAIDLYGYGDSAMPESRGRHSLLDEVRLVESTLEKVLVQGERFHLVGHSFGGGVALRLLHANPARIRSLCLYEPTTFHLLEPGEPAFEEASSVANGVKDAIHSGHRLTGVELFIDYWNGVGAYAALPSSRQALFASLLPKVMLDFEALVSDPLRASDYSRMTVPTCLIAGHDSPASTRAIVSLLADSLVNRETHEVDAGHMGPLTHAGLVNPIIDGFIRRIDAHASNPPMRTGLEAFSLSYHRLSPRS